MKIEEENIVSDILNDFRRRQKERRSYENNWITNINFYIGNQYYNVDEFGVVRDFAKQYYWQEREVFNHIAPLIDVRLSRLSRVRPTMTVVPFSDSESDVYKADMSRKILDVVSRRLNLSNIIAEATVWSEMCGTSFYKVIWDSDLGDVIGAGDAIHAGDVSISVVSPFEIFPDSTTYQKLEDCKSIIHARAYHRDYVKDKWGVDAKGEDIDVYSLDTITSIGGLGYSASSLNAAATKKSDQVLVLEKYSLPTKDYPDGRLQIVAGKTLVYDGILPLKNNIDGKRGYPFVRQCALCVPNSFFGLSIIDRCVPLQRAYNAVKNRKHEYMNRMAMGVLTVEDGSIDTDNLEEEGMSPGKVLIYRQGSTPPRMLGVENAPFDFTREEQLLEDEMKDISGISDLLSNISTFRNVSGVALQLLIEQDETRLIVTADEIRNATKEISKQILSLYKHYCVVKQSSKVLSKSGDLEMFYWNGSDISYEDIIFETENEINQTLAQKRSYILELLSSGLLSERDGTLAPGMKSKILDSLGYGMWDTTQDIDNLHDSRADSENLNMQNNVAVAVSEVDDHDRHIRRHTAYIVSNNLDSIHNKSLYDRVLEHIHEHERMKQTLSMINATMQEQ